MNKLSIFFIGGILGSIAGWMLGYLKLPYIEKNHSFFLGFLSCIVLVTAFLLIVYLSRNKVIIDSSQISKQKEKGSNITKGSWLIISALIAIGSGLLSFTIFRIEKLNTKQQEEINQSIKTQDKIMASTRKSNATILINDLANKIEIQLDNSPKRQLSHEIIDRIKALNYSFSPFNVQNGIGDSLYQYSPERGQLLLILATLGLDSFAFSEIKSSVEFQGADLEGADLRKVDLSGIDLRDANLDNADLSGANLTDSNLEKATIRKADLNNAILTEANLQNSNLEWSNLDKVKARSTLFEGAYLDNASFRSADLQKTNLSWTSMRYVILSDANLENANLTAAVLIRANLTNAKLTNSIMSSAEMNEAILHKTDLRGAKLINVKVNTADWLLKLSEWDIYGNKNIQESYFVAQDPNPTYTFRLQAK